MNYIIKYNLILFNEILYDKEIKVKNKDSELIAKVSLEDYLKRKYGDSFRQLVITSCLLDNPFEHPLFTDIFGGYGKF